MVVVLEGQKANLSVSPYHLPCILTLPSCPVCVSCPALQTILGGKKKEQEAELAETEARKVLLEAAEKHALQASALCLRVSAVVYCCTGSCCTSLSVSLFLLRLLCIRICTLRHYSTLLRTTLLLLLLTTYTKEYSYGTTRGTYKLAAWYSHIQ